MVDVALLVLPAGLAGHEHVVVVAVAIAVVVQVLAVAIVVVAVVVVAIRVVVLLSQLLFDLSTGLAVLWAAHHVRVWLQLAPHRLGTVQMVNSRASLLVAAKRRPPLVAQLAAEGTAAADSGRHVVLRSVMFEGLD